MNQIEHKSLNRVAVSALAAISLAGFLYFSVGCQSFKSSNPGYLATVNISNHSVDEITNAMTTVFIVNGFNGGKTGTNEYTYRRQGGTADQIAYGSYMFNETVMVKVVVSLQQISTNWIRMGCNAWRVKSEGDVTFSESYKVGSMNKGPYEEMLNEIKTRLGP
jgi:hypothetical protein